MASACNICAEVLFGREQDISALQCGHTFHRCCLDKWWVNHETCPNCRQACEVKIDKLYFENLEEDLVNLNLRIKELQNSLEETEDIKNSLQGQLNITKDSLLQRPTVEELELLKRRISILEGEIRSSTEENTLLRNGAAETIILVGTATQFQKASEQKLEAMVEENKRLDSLVNELKLDNDEACKNMCKLRTIITELETKIARHKEEIKLLKAQVAEKIQQKERIHTVIRENKRLETVVTELALERANLDNTLREKQEENSALQECNNRFADENRELKVQIAQKIQVMQKFEQIKTAGKQKLKTMIENNKKLESTLKDFRCNKSGVEKSFPEQQAQISELKRENVRLKEEIEVLQTQTADNTHSLQDVNQLLLERIKQFQNKSAEELEKIIPFRCFVESSARESMHETSANKRHFTEKNSTIEKELHRLKINNEELFAQISDKFHKANELKKNSDQILVSVIEKDKKLESTVTELRFQKAGVEKDLCAKQAKIAKLETKVARYMEEYKELKVQSAEKIKSLQTVNHQLMTREKLLEESSERQTTKNEENVLVARTAQSMQQEDTKDETIFRIGKLHSAVHQEKLAQRHTENPQPRTVVSQNSKLPKKQGQLRINDAITLEAVTEENKLRSFHHITQDTGLYEENRKPSLTGKETERVKRKKPSSKRLYKLAKQSQFQFRKKVNDVQTLCFEQWFHEHCQIFAVLLLPLCFYLIMCGNQHENRISW